MPPVNIIKGEKRRNAIGQQRFLQGPDSDRIHCQWMDNYGDLLFLVRPVREIPRRGGNSTERLWNVIVLN